MKTTMTAVALVLALGTAAHAQDAKTATQPAAPAVTQPAAKPVPAPEQMQKVGAPTTPAVAQPKVEAKPAATPAPAATAPAVVKPAVAAPTAPAATKAAAPAATAAKLVNINTVSAADLEKLPKIGDVRAKQIIAARPFKNVDELLARKVIPQDAFDAVKALVTVK